jgi:hypothetical protein
MAKPIRDVRHQQNSQGADGKALTDREIQEKLLNYLTVSGGYISTERDELGNIMLHEDPNNLGSQLKLVTQYISIDVERRDYDDDEIQKVFDTTIDELYKLPKTKTSDELRAEIERLRQLLADAEAEITVVENVVGDGDGSGDGDGGGGDGDGDGGAGTTILANGDRLAPFILNVEDYTINIQTVIWDTETQRIIPEQINSAEQAINYEIQRNNSTNEVTIRLLSKIANPQYFQGWFYDAENLGNTQDYDAIGNGENVITLSLTDDREANRGDPNDFTFALGYKNEAPPVVTTDPITVQTAQFLAQTDEFNGKRDEVTANATWTLVDEAGNLVRESSQTTRNRDTGEFETSRVVQTPFTLGVSPGQVLTIRVSQVRITFGQGIEGWWNVSDNDVNTEILSGTSGQWNNQLVYTIPSDIKGILIAYDPT